MSEVTRYSIFVVLDDWECEVDNEGDWVQFSDYGQLKEKLWHSEMTAEALKAERDALRKQLDGAKELLIRIAKHVDIPASSRYSERSKSIKCSNFTV